MTDKTQDALFPTIGTVAEQTDQEPVEAPTETQDEDADRPLQEIESLCMSCGQNGITRLLLTTIPYFREVIVMSFECEHCGAKNNEIQSAGTIREHGTIHTTRILNREDMNRQLVKSPSCTVSIPEYELTIPASKGQLTTIEGLLRDVVHDLSMDQPLRHIESPDAYEKIDGLLNKIKTNLSYNDDEEEGGKGAEADVSTKEDHPITPFTVKLDDPAGNSWIEFYGSTSDPKWNLRTYNRTVQQNIDLGLVDESVNQPKSLPDGADAESTETTEKIDNEEIFVFPGNCSSCGNPLDTLMKKVSIPYFKDILIMSTNCDICGYRDNEVKSGSAISENGKRITLKVEDREDLSRDVLKSETCGLTIPEIDLTLQPGTLGGRFTTLEGLLDQVYEELSEKVFAHGDSATNNYRAFETFLENLKSVKNAEKPFTLILEDPLANSYLQNLYAPDPDPNMQVESFTRTWDQNEDLGLNDIKVENYSESS